jgi:4-hydroxy-tetrahydrodipicolinate reductase
VIKVCVAGAGGRMGQMVLAALGELHGHARVVSVLHAPRRQPAAPLAGVPNCDDPAAALAEADVYVDFTSADGTLALAAAAAAGRRPVAAVIGTTGLGATEQAALDDAATRVPLLHAPNFSLGVNLMLGLAEKAAQVLGPGFDLEVVELHHRAKKDAPSGTALALVDALARGRGLDPALARRASRDGLVGARPDAEIGVMAIRGGDVVGEHTAYFLGKDERLELTHRATSRMVFARGAVRAAMWLAGKPAGRYTMKDVLGLG